MLSAMNSAAWMIWIVLLWCVIVPIAVACSAVILLIYATLSLIRHGLPLTADLDDFPVRWP